MRTSNSRPPPMYMIHRLLRPPLRPLEFAILAERVLLIPFLRRAW